MQEELGSGTEMDELREQSGDMMVEEDKPRRSKTWRKYRKNGIIILLLLLLVFIIVLLVYTLNGHDTKVVFVQNERDSQMTTGSKPVQPVQTTQSFPFTPTTLSTTKKWTAAAEKKLPSIYAHLVPDPVLTTGKDSKIYWLEGIPSFTSHDIGIKTDDKSIILIDYTGIYTFRINLCICCHEYCSLATSVAISVFQNKCRRKKMYRRHIGTQSSSFFLLLKKGDAIYLTVEKMKWKPFQSNNENSLDIVLERLALLEAMPLDGPCTP